MRPLLLLLLLPAALWHAVPTWTFCWPSTVGQPRNRSRWYRVDGGGGTRSSTVLLTVTGGFTAQATTLGALAPQEYDEGQQPPAAHPPPPPDPDNSSNLLTSISSLQNDFFVLRHGQSLANVEGLIQSDPVRAGMKYGLSDLGQQQAKQVAHTVRQVFFHNQDDDDDNSTKYRQVVILSSDLLRAQETAAMVCQEIRATGVGTGATLTTTTRSITETTNQDDLHDMDGAVPIYQDAVIVDTRLRERWFGEWDGTTDDNYHKVWELDAVDAGHQNMGVESVNSVMRRACQCVVEWEDQLNKKKDGADNKPAMVILVAHGDVLQILQSAFSKIDGRRHRRLPHLETAQLRQLHLAS